MEIVLWFTGILLVVFPFLLGRKTIINWVTCKKVDDLIADSILTIHTYLDPDKQEIKITNGFGEPLPQDALLFMKDAIFARLGYFAGRGTTYVFEPIERFSKWDVGTMNFSQGATREATTTLEPVEVVVEKTTDEEALDLLNKSTLDDDQREIEKYNKIKAQSESK